MISGSLLINDKSFQNADLFFKRRIKRILVPLIFWSVFFIGFNRFITGFFSVKDTVGRLYTGEPYYHLWYLYLVVGLYFVTPAVSLVYANFSRKKRISVIAAIFIAAAINSMWSEYFGVAEQFFAFKFLPYLGYFMIGKELSDHKPRYHKYFYFGIWLLLSLLIGISTGLLKYLNFKDFTYFYDYLNPLVILQSISFYVFMTQFISAIRFREEYKNVISYVSVLTFGIYIIHPVFVEMGIEVMEKFNVQNNMLVIPIFAFTAVLFSGVVAFIFTKIPYLRNLV